MGSSVESYEIRCMNNENEKKIFFKECSKNILGPGPPLHGS
jgi:hypothetical protein